MDGNDTWFGRHHVELALLQDGQRKKLNKTSTTGCYSEVYCNSLLLRIKLAFKITNYMVQDTGILQPIMVVMLIPANDFGRALV